MLGSGGPSESLSECGASSIVTLFWRPWGAGFSCVSTRDGGLSVVGLLTRISFVFTRCPCSVLSEFSWSITSCGPSSTTLSTVCSIWANTGSSAGSSASTVSSGWKVGTPGCRSISALFLFRVGLVVNSTGRAWGQGLSLIHISEPTRPY